MNIRTFLGVLIDDHRRRNQMRLPPIADIARMGGYSATTVSNALADYVKKGICTVTPRKGIVLTPSGLQPSADSVSSGGRRRAETIAEMIARDISKLWFTPGTLLPQMKMLCQKYGVCHATIQSALRLLIERGIIVPYKKRYRVEGIGTPHSYSSIVLIASAKDKNFYSSNHSMEFWRGLEIACLERNIHLHLQDTEYFSKDNPWGRTNCQTEEPVSEHMSVIGYIVRLLDMEPHTMEMVLQMCRRLDAPVSILFEVPYTTIPSWVFREGKFRIFSVGLTDVHGSTAGKFLFGLGHRTIAFFLPHGSTDSAGMKRFEGMKRFIKTIAPKASVRLFTHSKKQFTSLIQSPRVIDAIKEEMISIEKLVEDGMNQQTNISLATHWLAEQIGEQRNKTVLFTCMESLFAKALENRSLTAWVGFNDIVAIEALRFLHLHNVQVPKQISVMGFDNTLESFGQGLTSYSFNIHALTNAMVDHILGRPNPFLKESGNVIEIPGHIHERKTTRNR